MRLYVHGKLQNTELDVTELAKKYAKPHPESSYLWLETTVDDQANLQRLADELEVHELAIEDAISGQEQQKVTRFPDYILVHLHYPEIIDDEVAVTRITAIVSQNLMVTIREHDFPIELVQQHLDRNNDLARYGVNYLVWGLLDVVVDQTESLLQRVDDGTEDIESRLFSDEDPKVLQAEAFKLRRLMTAGRRLCLGQRTVVSSWGHQEGGVEPEQIRPYFSDVMDHAVRDVETADELREYLGTILETIIALQGNRMNEVMKKVTSWAAIIAIPTLITGFFGQNLAFIGFNTVWGAWVAVALILATSWLLWWQFRRRNWL